MRPDGGAAVRLDDPFGFDADAAEASAEALLADAVRREFPGRIALVSSFGASSIVLLHLVARVDPGTPVLFLETGKLFPETLAYAEAVTARLGLSDVRHLAPAPEDIALRDADGTLFRSDVGACCAIRKVAPLERALSGLDAWITGRRRGQTAGRAGLPVREMDGGGRVKINPLADWSAVEVAAYMERHELPQHPLVGRGYPSIGCAPCTTPVAPGEDERAGRWRGSDREECGIHFIGGRLVRMRTAAPAPMDTV